MLTLTTLAVFAASTLALLAVPGPSVIYVVARSAEHGRTAGLVSMLGLEVGALLHVILAAAGVSAILTSTPWAFNAIRWLGAGYLVTMGIQQLRHRPRLDAAPAAAVATRSYGRLFRDGVLVDVLNPKTALFFLAFLPQFVDPGRGQVSLQILALGLCFVLLAALVDSSYALGAAALRVQLTRSVSNARGPRTALPDVMRKLTAFVYFGLGGVAVLA